MAEVAVPSISAAKLPKSLINPYTKSSDAKLLFGCHDLIRRRSRVSRKTLTSNSPKYSPECSRRRLGDGQWIPSDNIDTKGRMNGNKSAARRLIRISTSSDYRWKGNWTSNFIFSIKELHLHDLAEQGQENTLVSIDLYVQKHAGFGLSVDGKITSSLPRKCICCGSSYIMDIDTDFNVWVLPSSKRNHGLPDIGSEDPSVIYVKPGCEADLDALILDTIRLAASIKETCNESCDKIEPMIIQNREEPGKGTSTSMVDKRWEKLLELKKGMHAS